MNLFADTHVLIADPNRFIAGILNGMLRSLGASQVYICSSPRKTLDILENTPVDVALIDDTISRKSALPMIRRLRGDAAASNASVPVILLTSSASRTYIRSAIDAGVNEILVKPVSQSIVKSRLHWVLTRPRTYITSVTYTGPDRRRRRNRLYRGPERRRAQVVVGKAQSALEVVEI